MKGTKLINYLLLIVTMVGACNSKTISTIKYNTKIFSRVSDGKVEKFKIDFDRKLFTYEVIGEAFNYVGNGTLEKNEDKIDFKFPAFSEYAGLPVYSEESWQLNLIDTSKIFEIKVTTLDVDTKKEFRGEGFFVRPMNGGTNVRRSKDRKNVKVITQDSTINIVFRRTFKKEMDIIKIPGKGKYELVFNMVSPKTQLWYETTTKGCYSSTVNPTITMMLCQKLNQEIISFAQSKDCKNQYTLMK